MNKEHLTYGVIGLLLGILVGQALGSWHHRGFRMMGGHGWNTYYPAFIESSGQMPQMMYFQGSTQSGSAQCTSQGCIFSTSTSPAYPY